MALPKIQDARELTGESLNDEILRTKRQLFELRFQQATRKFEKPHQFKHLRHRLAQLLTVERERQISEQDVASQQGNPDVIPTVEEDS